MLQTKGLLQPGRKTDRLTDRPEDGRTDGPAGGQVGRHAIRVIQNHFIFLCIDHFATLYN